MHVLNRLKVFFERLPGGTLHQGLRWQVGSGCWLAAHAREVFGIWSIRSMHGNIRRALYCCTGNPRSWCWALWILTEA